MRLKPLLTRGDPELCQKGGAVVRGKKVQGTARPPVLGTFLTSSLIFRGHGWMGSLTGAVHLRKCSEGVQRWTQ